MGKMGREINIFYEAERSRERERDRDIEIEMTEIPQNRFLKNSCVKW